MNRKPSDNELGSAVTSSVYSLDVPAFNLAAIRARHGTSTVLPSTLTPRPRISRRALVAAPIAIAVVALLVSMPSVIAQVQGALKAFAIVHGETVPLDVQTVTLDQARAQMPFQVIAPAGVPARWAPTIHTLSSPASPESARLIFQYNGSGGLPALTIEESSATAKGPTGLMLSETRVVGGAASGHHGVAAPQAPQMPLIGARGLASSGKGDYVVRDVEVKRVNGHTAARRFEIHPLVWVSHGTRIVLAPTPGTLTQAQLQSIRAAMSR
ncbi:MAG: hypothetical protein JO060_07325 [Candidatus Eremiobacteraeota bacterium]|nr:hypothetical protein [Candidatus Eremiobacteraeota bacterium]